MRLITLILILMLFVKPVLSQDDPMGELVETVKDKDAITRVVEAKENSERHIEKKTELNANDVIAKKAIEKSAIGAAEVEFKEPTAEQKAQFKSEYEQSIQKVKQKDTNLFIKTDLFPAVPVFSVPGFHEEDCSNQNLCQVKDHVTSNSKITSMGEISILETTNESKSTNYDGFIKVKYQAVKDNNAESRTGWMQADLLTADQNYQPLYKKTVVEEKCNECNGNSTSIEEQKKTFDEINRRAKLPKSEQYALELQDQYELVNPLVGMCIMNKPREKLHKAKNQYYDEQVLPVVAKAAAKSVNPTQAQIIQIDAISRTLWGEMHPCFKNGLQYPMAIARIIMNRAQYTDTTGSTEFVDDRLFPHSPLKTTIAKAGTQPIKFSVYNNSLTKTGPINPHLGKIACPPSGKKDFYFDSQLVPEQSKAEWENAVKIATEMTMYPEKFKERTKQFEKIYFYTSGASRICGITKKVQLSIEKHPVNLSSCLNIFADQPGPKSVCPDNKKRQPAQKNTKPKKS